MKGTEIPFRGAQLFKEKTISPEASLLQDFHEIPALGLELPVWLSPGAARSGRDLRSLGLSGKPLACASCGLVQAEPLGALSPLWVRGPFIHSQKSHLPLN